MHRYPVQADRPAAGTGPGDAAAAIQQALQVLAAAQVPASPTAAAFALTADALPQQQQQQQQQQQGQEKQGQQQPVGQGQGKHGQDTDQRQHLPDRQQWQQVMDQVLGLLEEADCQPLARLALDTDMARDEYMTAGQQVMFVRI